jgi:hypothetical protein
MELKLDRTARRRREQGLSLVEVLIAALLLVIVALGLVPLITRAMASNVSGADSTTVSNHSKTGAEGLRQASFFWEELIVPNGQTAALRTYYWAQGDRDAIGDAGEGWTRMAVPPDPDTVLPPPVDPALGLIHWRRNQRVHYYHIDDLVGDGRFNDPLDGSTDPVFVHLKDFEVEVEGVEGASAVIGVRRRIAVRTLKAF